MSDLPCSRTTLFDITRQMLKACIFTIFSLGLTLASARSWHLYSPEDWRPSPAARAIAGSSKPATDSGDARLNPIKSAVRKYRQSQAVAMQVKKEVYLALLEQKKISEGQLFYSKGRLRLELTQPEKSLLVADGQRIWVVNEPDPDFGGKTQVAKIGASGKKRRSNALLAMLFEDEGAWEQFKVNKNSTNEDVVALELVPKKEANLSEITKVAVKVNKKTDSLLEIIYWDDIDNKTSYMFSRVDFNANIPAEKFAYKPPKDAEVTEY